MRVTRCSICIIVLCVAVVSMGRGVAAQEGVGGVQEIFELNKQIDAKSDRLDEIKTQIERFRKSITQEQGRARSLRQQLAVVEDRLSKKRLEIERARTEQEQVELEVQATKLEMEESATRIERRRDLLSALLSRLRATDEQPALQVILAQSSMSSYFSYRNQLTQLQYQVRTILADVRAEHEGLAASTLALEDRQEELLALSQELQQQQSDFQNEQDAKSRLLTQTRSNEQRYQDLVSQLRAEVAAIDAEIVALESQVRARLEEIDENFGKLGHVAFSWPVPNRGITAYFHDPEYPYRHIFEHPAIDIRASQGDTIHAPAPGYVAKTKDNGYGYSYIMLVHPGEFSTVYGHVSCFSVEEGMYVERGQAIGCVGGRPGTPGAGSLTTGAHLHFEIRLNGIPVNPLNYLL